MAQTVRLLPCHGFSTIINKPSRAAASVRVCVRFFSQPRSFFDHHEGTPDPGHWAFSPEWWGTQGQGWGRNSGVTVFERLSRMGNGLVSVTAHPASSSGLEDWPDLSRLLQGRQVATTSEWRVLRFNHETRQSVAKVIVVEGQDFDEPCLMQIPNCLAFEYLKSMVAVGLSSVCCAGLNLDLVAKGMKEMRCLCVGLGGGSLPLFLANKLQGCFVEVVEIDDTVISAATEFMGFPGNGFKSSQQSVHASRSLNAPDDSLHLQEGMAAQAHSSTECITGSSSIAGSLWGKVQDRIKGFEADGVAYICKLLHAAIPQKQHYDIVFIDAFDGRDEVPSCFWSRGGPFLTALRDLLNPNHGTAVVNLHTDSPPPSLLERITGDFGPGYDPHLPGGKQLEDISHMYRNELLVCPATRLPDKLEHHDCCAGVAFTVAVPRQQNICLVVSRGINGMKAPLVENLMSAASCLERALDIPFPMSKRVSRGIRLVH